MNPLIRPGGLLPFRERHQNEFRKNELTVECSMNPYWIKNEAFQLGIIPRPRGQDWLADDIGALRQAGVDVIVSALTPAETEEWGLRDESRCCEHRGLRQSRSGPLLGRGWTFLSDCGLCTHSERTFGG
jgi:hypothetical protein